MEIIEIIKSSPLLEKKCFESSHDLSKITKKNFDNIMEDLTLNELEIIIVEMIHESFSVFIKFKDTDIFKNKLEILHNELTKRNKTIKKDIEDLTIDDVLYLKEKIDDYKKSGYDFFEFVIKYSLKVYKDKFAKLRDNFDYLKEQCGV